MSKTDEFDELLKRSFRKSNDPVADDGFSESVMSNLPTNRISLIKRKIILYLPGALSVFIFYISDGYKCLFLSVADIFNNGFHGIRLSLISFFVVSVFIGVSFIISRIEYDEPD
jgi:hypothetical protein